MSVFLSMKPPEGAPNVSNASWRFRAPIEQINIVRICEELEDLDCDHALVEIDGKLYTAVSVDHPLVDNIPDPVHIDFDSYTEDSLVDRDGHEPAGIPEGEIVVRGDACCGDWVFQSGNHLHLLVRPIVTKVWGYK